MGLEMLSHEERSSVNDFDASARLLDSLDGTHRGITQFEVKRCSKLLDLLSALR